jgi:hypothetical protein
MYRTNVSFRKPIVSSDTIVGNYYTVLTDVQSQMDGERLARAPSTASRRRLGDRPEEVLCSRRGSYLLSNQTT